MAKFSKEFRLKLVLEVEDQGQPLKAVARNYRVGKSTLRTWVYNNRVGGVEQLVSIKQKYTQDFKLEAIEYRWTNDIS
ncbi:MAG: transposase [Clostridia bacterium]|nr:transposase [Clostridia bacterium]